MKNTLLYCFLLLSAGLFAQGKPGPAPTPPMGWNSYNCFGATVQESEVKANADYVHGLGLKFGIHIMRGIPRQAVWAKSPILGTKGITADQIVDTTSVCPWLNNMWGVDMSKPGAQEYYNSIFNLYASWGVDYVKMDDVDGDPGYPYRRAEVAAAHKAIAQCGRPMVLSLSLNLKWENREHVAENSNIWRISMDFWDNWQQLEKQFEHCRQWSEISAPNAFPDADMLQIGKLSKRGPVGPERWSQFTNEELYTHFTLWTIFRSPLMMGGNMPENTPFIEKLLSNDEVIAVNQKGYDAHELYRRNGACVWVSQNPDSQDLNLAFFNLSETQKDVSVSLVELGLKGKWQVRDVWEQKDLNTISDKITQSVNPHGARLFRISKK